MRDEKVKVEVRKHLTPYPASQQLAFDSFETRSALEHKYEMGHGIVDKGLDRHVFWLTNIKLFTPVRWMEMLNVMRSMTIEFEGATEIRNLFRSYGVDTRTDDAWEMYLEREVLLSNYCIRVKMNADQDFIEVHAFAK